MKKKYIGVLSLFCITISLSAATIRVYNKLGNNEDIIVTAITTQKKIVEPIESMRSHFFNTWFDGITGFEWEIKGFKWAAPLEMRALQTEGRLYIERNGKYTFKPCLPCRESNGHATLISSPPAPAPKIPTPPVLPPAPTKKQRNKNLLQDIRDGKKLTPTQKRKLNSAPDTRTPRAKLLDDIQKGTPLKKTNIHNQTKYQHEMIDPLSKAIDARREQLKKLQQDSTADDSRDWED